MKNDMTVGSARRTIALFALPIMIGNLLQQLYNTVDGIVVGNYVSEAALAAVGSCGTLAFVFLAVSIGMSAGCGIYIAQLFGAKRTDELKSAVSTSLILLVGLGLVLAIFGAVCARWLLRGLMNVTDAAILDDATVYFAIYSIGLLFQFAYNAVAQILRSIGDSRATLYFLAVAAVANLFLDLLFVVVFRWGVAGAAIATTLAQMGSVAVSFVYMFKKYPMFRMSRKEFVFDRKKCGIILALAVPATVQQCVVSFGHVFMQRLVNSFGEVTMAAYTVGSRIENYIFVPIQGFHVGMSTFAGQNIGAGRIDRVQKGWRQIQGLAFITTAVFSALVWGFAGPISGLFGVAGETMSQAIQYCRYQSIFFVIFSAYMVSNGTLQGAGDVKYTGFATLGSLAVRVLAAYGLEAMLHIGYTICWLTVPLGWGVGLVLSFARYFSGVWKKKAVVTAATEA